MCNPFFVYKTVFLFDFDSPPVHFAWYAATGMISVNLNLIFHPTLKPTRIPDSDFHKEHDDVTNCHDCVCVCVCVCEQS